MVVDETEGSVVVQVTVEEETEQSLVGRDPSMLPENAVTEYGDDPPDIVPVRVSVWPEVPDEGEEVREENDNAGFTVICAVVPDAAACAGVVPVSVTVAVNSHDEVVPEGE